MWSTPTRRSRSLIPAQLVRIHARVTLRRVEVLVAEQLLDLAQVRAGAEELGGGTLRQRMRCERSRFGEESGGRKARDSSGRRNHNCTGRSG